MVLKNVRRGLFFQRCFAIFAAKFRLLLYASGIGVESVSLLLCGKINKKKKQLL